MKVTPNNAQGLQNLEAAKSKKNIKGQGNENARQVSAADIASSSKVNISSKAQDIQRAKEVIAKTPDIDEAKVARLQKMIDSGQYKTDAKAIADKLVDEHLIFSE